MIEAVYEAIKQQKDVRKNLSLFRQCLKEETPKVEIQPEVFINLLSDSDAKVRKNAALALGDIECEEALFSLYHAYEIEEKNFVKSSYLIAMGKLDCKKYLPDFKRRYENLCAIVPTEEEKKHVNEQIKELEKIFLKYEGRTKHKFTGYKEKNSILLTVSKECRGIVCEQLKREKTQMHPLGVVIEAADLTPYLYLRTYRELLFLLDCSKKLEGNPDTIGKELAESNLLEKLEKCHEGAAPFYFRLEIRSSQPLDKRTVFAKRIAAVLEEKSGRRLINSTSDYEVEIRLLQSKDGYFFPCVKLYTIPMRRFSYRKNSIATSIHPATAALMMEIARPYLQEGAQVLDPFCGVGTMLIERDKFIPAGDMYGTDIFGEAIEKARENTALAEKKIAYVNRDFFDFTHEYLFDEIISNMPVKGKKTKEEQSAFYEHFFEKAAKHLKENGVMVLYSNEKGFIKRQMRVDKRFHLLKEYLMREKDEYYLFVIRFKGENA